MPPQRRAPKSGPSTNGASPHELHVLALDPFGPFAMLVPIVQTRIQAFATGKFPDPEMYTRHVMQRLYTGDRLQKILVFWDATQSKPAGHALAEILAQGRAAWVYVAQCQIDDGVNSAGLLDKGLELVEAWALEVGRQAQPPVSIDRIRVGTDRNAAAIYRRYGFEEEHAVMVRQIGAPTRTRETVEA